MFSVITARMQSEMVAVLTGEVAPFLASMQPGLSLPTSVLGEQRREGEQDSYLEVGRVRIDHLSLADGSSDRILPLSVTDG